MKILYDHQAFIWENGGVVRYFNDLVKALPMLDDVEVELSLKLSNNEYLDKQQAKNIIQYKPFLGKQNTNRLASLFNRLNSIHKLNKGNFDVFHPTFFNNYFLKYLENKPFVITFHDCIKEQLNLDHLDNANYEQKQDLINCASKIIAVSEHTKTDLQKFYQVKPEKIEVIYHSTDFQNLPKIQSLGLTLPEKYLLYVGARNDYKNFDGLLNAIAKVFENNKDVYLLCAGGRSFSNDEMLIIKSLDLEKRIIHQKIHTDSMLAELYRKAIAFIYPSKYEGFGIPILEAFACECPVVLSNSSCFPEIAQDAGLYFEPDNQEDMGDKLIQIINNNILRKYLISKGLNRIEAFSSVKKIQATYLVYKSVM